MTSDETRIVWVIDEIDDELETTVTALTRAARDIAKITIEKFRPKPNKEAYLPMLENPNTGAIILDQKLQTRGGIAYTGIELALFMRDVNQQLPIYILTGYATTDGEPNDEFTGLAWSVEDILPKSILGDKDEMNIFIERLIRRINVFHKIRDQREQKFQELLLESLNRELTTEEQIEFNKISIDRLGALALSDQIQQNKIESKLEELFRKVESKLSLIDDEPDSDDTD